jgi:hypothetical protein
MKKHEENKIMTSNIKARMFRGYNQIIKNKKKERKLEKLKNLELNLNDLIFVLRSKTKSNKEYFPFEIDYDYSYRNKYSNKIDDIKADDLKIENLSKNYNKRKLKSKNMFLTQTKNKTECTNTDLDAIELENKKSTFKKLFPDQNEIYKYSELPFFSLTKNPNNYGYVGNTMVKLKKDDDIFSQEDFLYRLSHKRENPEKYNLNNFNKNKEVIKGNVLVNINDRDNKNNKDKKNIKLTMDIENMNNNKTAYLDSKEKRYKILEKEIEPLKNVISLFKDFATEIEKEDNIDIEKTKSEKTTPIDNSKNNSNVIKKESSVNITNNENNIELIASRTAYSPHIFKKPKLYPINHYALNQVIIKEKRYERMHKMGLEDFQRKINLKNEKENVIKNIYKKKYIMDEYEKEYFKRLFTKEKISVRDAYLRKCRINDIILVSKLKCEFSPRDVKRVLNGIKPWNDCQKLDQKFIEKNLPSKVGNIKTIKIE